MKKTRILSSSLILSFVILLFFVGFFKKGFLKSSESFDDSFGMRDDLIKLVNNIKFYVFRDRFFHLMYTVDHQWFNYTGELSYDDYQNTIPFSDAELAIIQGKMDRMLSTLREQGISLYVVVPPNKLTIYGDDMQAIAPKFSEESRLDQLVNYCNTHGELKIIDLRPALFKASEEGQTFYNTDTHWNDYGAFIGYTEIMNVISKDFTELQPHPLNDFYQKPTEFIYGDLPYMNKLLNVKEETILFVLKDPSEYELVEKEEDGLLFKTYTTKNNTLPKAMTFRDSFFNALFPYVSQHFSRLHSIYTFFINHELIMDEQPDLLIIELSERFIHLLVYLPY